MHGRLESMRPVAIRTLRKAQQSKLVDPPESSARSAVPGNWFGKIQQFTMGALAFAGRAAGIIIVTTPTMPQESTETATSSTRTLDPTTTTKKLESTTTTKQLEPTTTTKQLEPTTTTKKLEPTTTTKQLESTTTTKKLEPTTTTKKLEPTTTTKKLEPTTTTKKLEPTTTTKKLEPTTTTKKFYPTKKLCVTSTKTPDTTTKTRRHFTTTPKKLSTPPRSSTTTRPTTSTQQIIFSTKKPCPTKGHQHPVDGSASSKTSNTRTGKSGKSSVSSAYHKKLHRSHGRWQDHNRRAFMEPSQTNTSFQEPLRIGASQQASSSPYSTGLVSLAIGGGIVLSVGAIVLLIMLYRHYQSQNTILPVVDLNPKEPSNDQSRLAKNSFFAAKGSTNADDHELRLNIDSEIQEKGHGSLTAAAC